MAKMTLGSETVEMTCPEIISNVHENLKNTGKFNNLFSCISENESERSECRENRLEFEEECNLFTKTVKNIIPNIPEEMEGYPVAKLFIGCFPEPKDFWGVCDTAVEEHKTDEECAGLCNELMTHTEL